MTSTVWRLHARVWVRKSTAIRTATRTAHTYTAHTSAAPCTTPCLGQQVVLAFIAPSSRPVAQRVQ